LADPQSAISLIAGLGNPGPEYDQTRHNAGFWFVDELARRHGVTLRRENRFHGWLGRARIDGHDVWLLKPDTFMNLSGQSIVAVALFYKIPRDAILIAHDELDLPPGTARLKRGGGHGGHNGLRSTIQHLSGPDFLRLRLGIGHPGHKDDVVDYVLHRPSRDDQRAIEDAIDGAADQVPLLLAGEFERAMHVLHSSKA
jgi:PTH1 family peptidyl-tRNA hydrolase